MPSLADVITGVAEPVDNGFDARFARTWDTYAPQGVRQMGNLAVGGLQDLVDTIKTASSYQPGLRRADYTDEPGPEPNTEAAGASGKLALNLLGTSLPFAEKGAAGIFGGRLSQTADLKKLQRAEQMAAEGAHPNAIWDETGWFQGPEGAWKYEIGDQNAAFRPMAEHGIMPPPGGYDTKGRAALMEHLLDHPELFEAYPWLRRYLMEWGEPYKFPGFTTKAAMYPEGKQGWLNPEALLSREDQLSSLLHEIQHAIQKHEGFARGASPSHPVVQTAVEAELTKRMGGLENRLDALYAGRDAWVAEQQAAGSTESPTRLALDYWRQNPYLHGQAQQAQKEISEMGYVGTRRDVESKFYRNVAGEVESRNVQVRQHYTDEQRRNIRPWEDDIPYGEQLLRLGD